MAERDPPQPTDAGPGYPEEGPPGTGIDPREHAEAEIPDGDDRETPEGDPGQATGNPRAAGATEHD